MSTLLNDSNIVTHHLTAWWQQTVLETRFTGSGSISSFSFQRQKSRARRCNFLRIVNCPQFSFKSNFNPINKIILHLPDYWFPSLARWPLLFVRVILNSHKKSGKCILMWFKQNKLSIISLINRKALWRGLALRGKETFCGFSQHLIQWCLHSYYRNFILIARPLFASVSCHNQIMVDALIQFNSRWNFSNWPKWEPISIEFILERNLNVLTDESSFLSRSKWDQDCTELVEETSI